MVGGGDRWMGTNYAALLPPPLYVLHNPFCASVLQYMQNLLWVATFFSCAGGMWWDGGTSGLRVFYGGRARIDICHCSQTSPNRQAEPIWGGAGGKLLACLSPMEPHADM